MTADINSISTATAAKGFVEDYSGSHVKIGWTDLDGVMRGKYMSKDKFYSALRDGFGFCDVILGWDVNDITYDEGAGVTYTGWHTGFPDTKMQVVPSTARVIPFEENMPFFMCTMEDGQMCPRGILQNVLKKANGMGYKALAGFEYEFFVFNETPHSLREKGYKNLTPFTPGNFCYSVLRNSANSDFFQEILALGEEMNIPIEGLHTETGPGVLEAALGKAEGMTAADRASVFKTFMKVLAQRHEKTATFMSKWSNAEAGQSGHIHISLVGEEDDAPVFYDESDEHGMSAVMKSFVAGQRQLMPELLAMVAQTVNSYTRLVPGAWAPTASTWSVENRTCSLRVIKGSEKAQRVEYRVAAADANPYLALAVAIASGLWGIEQGLELTPPMTGNAYDAEVEDSLKLPRTLDGAADRLRQSKVARELFGDTFVEHFAASREWEAEQFRQRITDWELERYFEII